MELIVDLYSYMRKENIKNIYELAYLTEIEIDAIQRMAINKTKHRDFNKIEALKQKTNMQLGDLLVQLTERNEHLIARNQELIVDGGLVYFLQRPSDRLVKVGFTKDLNVRKETIGFEVKEKLEVLHYIPTSDPLTLEKTLHHVYADKWVEGEWFSLTENDIEKLKSRTPREEKRLERIKEKRSVATNNG